MAGQLTLIYKSRMSGDKAVGTTVEIANKEQSEAALKPFLESFGKVTADLTRETDGIWIRWNERQNIFLEKSAERFKNDMEKFQKCWLEDLSAEIRQQNREFFSDILATSDNTSFQHFESSDPSTLHSEDDYVEVVLDTSGYNAAELEVTVVDRMICVQGKHEERLKKGEPLVFREFTRKYPLPADAKPEDVDSILTRDGLLIITVH